MPPHRMSNQPQTPFPEGKMWHLGVEKSSLFVTLWNLHAVFRDAIKTIVHTGIVGRRRPSLCMSRDRECGSTFRLLYMHSSDLFCQSGRILSSMSSD